MKLLEYKIYFLFLLFLMIFVGEESIYAQKTDTLILNNGNVFTGEIEKYDLGILYFDMDGTGTIKIENQEINSMKSDKLLRIITYNKQIYYGDIAVSEESGKVSVGLLDYRETISFSEIVEIYPIRNTFWLRLSGKLEFGVDYAKSTSLLRVNGAGNVHYQKEKWAGDFAFSSLETKQSPSDDSIVTTSKSDFEISAEYLISPTWRISVSTGINTNSELGLAIRYFGSLSMKNYLIQTNRNRLFYEYGLTTNYELNSEDIGATNVEALLGANYSIFKYSRPEIDLSVFAYTYPNMQFNGRWRFDSGFDLAVELFYNFFLKFKIYYQFDSKPVSTNASNNDWGFTTGFGYSFN